MKKLLIIAALFAVLPRIAAGQVEKQVEVTKAYIPDVESAAKLAIVPDMTDTVTMRPEIDYTITPLSLRTTLSTRPIRPATVTYWQFNRPSTFYLKAGAGYPLNSVLDFYASSQNSGTGYVVGYVNHTGRYSKIANDFRAKNNSTQLSNRIGAAAGKYFGKRTLEGDISYDNHLYHRYGTYISPDMEGAFADPGAKINYSDANVAVRFGDDFKDLTRFNFETSLRGGFFFDHSDAPDYNSKARQTSFGADARIARGFGRHRFSLSVGYDRLAGQKAIADYKEQIIRAGLRYGVDGRVVRLEAGADYYYDDINEQPSEHYIIPFLRLAFDLGAQGIKPFLELDGRVRDNSFRTLTGLNPYLDGVAIPGKSSVDYNGRFGLGGSFGDEKLTYRLYAQFSIHDNHVYWYGRGVYDQQQEPVLAVQQTAWLALARQTVLSFHGQAAYRPVSALRVEAAASGYIYNDDTKLGNGAPAFEGKLSVHYNSRKISFGAGVYMQSVRKWSSLDTYIPFSQSTPALDSEVRYNTFEAPFAFDVRVNVDWRISSRVTLFAEGGNLANRKLYIHPWYPEYGANFTLGVKANF